MEWVRKKPTSVRMFWARDGPRLGRPARKRVDMVLGKGNAKRVSTSKRGMQAV